MRSRDSVSRQKAIALTGASARRTNTAETETPVPTELVYEPPAKGKEPWREAHRFVEERAKHAEGDDPGDLVLLHPRYLRLVWDYYDRRALDRELLPWKLVTPDEIYERHAPSFKERDRVFLVLAHEETEDPDAYFSVVGAAIFRAWSESGGTRIEMIPPILFDRSWGVRVAIFNRRSPTPR